MFEFEMSFEVDIEQVMFTRQRYTFWTALGDVGGLHDGLLLLINIFMASISAASFTGALTNDAKKLNPDLGGKSSRDERVRLAQAFTGSDS